ncbi:MAG: signal peptidase I [Anaerolineae bacterium]|nr:signal peptidase I [Anaerolineae bacterium]MDQ7037110.1 signal peptidase I [Anaerolineae bacterium]
MIDEKLKPQFRPKLKRPSLMDEIFRTIIFVIVVTVLFDMAIPRSLVDGSSMLPTFVDGERLIVSRVNYMVTTPQRGDVIVFNTVSAGESDIMLIKRVIGEPGDTIEWRDHQLYVNGQWVEEDYIRETCTSCPNETWVLASDEYFVMGDNRNHSRDSRSFGPVPIDHVVGRVIFRYWPLPRLGVIEGLAYDGVDS